MCPWRLFRLEMQHLLSGLIDLFLVNRVICLSELSQQTFSSNKRRIQDIDRSVMKKSDPPVLSTTEKRCASCFRVRYSHIHLYHVQTCIFLVDWILPWEKFSLLRSPKEDHISGTSHQRSRSSLVELLLQLLTALYLKKQNVAVISTEQETRFDCRSRYCPYKNGFQYCDTRTPMSVLVVAADPVSFGYCQSAY